MWGSNLECGNKLGVKFAFAIVKDFNGKVAAKGLTDNLHLSSRCSKHYGAFLDPALSTFTNGSLYSTFQRQYQDINTT